MTSLVSIFKCLSLAAFKGLRHSSFEGFSLASVVCGLVMFVAPLAARAQVQSTEASDAETQAAAVAVSATEVKAAGVDSAMVERLVNERYEAYVQRAHQRWLKLIPNLGVVQYAGDIGMLSAGLGWDYGKHDRWETIILFGYLPKFNSTHHDVTFTLKENLVPWSIDCTHGVTVQPAAFTFFVNSVFDEEFWTEEPDRYPSGYYGFSSRIRYSIGFGGRVSLDIPEAKRRRTDRVSLYYELSTCDLYLVSAVPNKHISFADILRLGLGVQYRFF
jgi:hypothetical protein